MAFTDVECSEAVRGAFKSLATMLKSRYRPQYKDTEIKSWQIKKSRN